MDAGKLLIVDESEEYRLGLARALQERYQVRCCADGLEALAVMTAFRPDVLVLDLLLPGLDGLTLLQQLPAAGLHPMVVAITQLYNPYILQALTRLDVTYLIRKPCNLPAAVARILDFGRICAAPEPGDLVGTMLLELSIPPKRDGYRYLREAIPLMAGNPMQSVTKELYPTVGRLCRADKTNVERSIRSAIHTAWQHRDEGIWRIYFAPDATGTIPRPTNATFLTRLAEVLLARQPRLRTPQII